MPYATAPDGVRVYYEVEGDGPPLVLMHGMLSRLDSWRVRDYVPRLAPHFRLLLIDARGHGESEAPEEQEAYELRSHVFDVSSVLGEAGVEDAHFLGYSMGCWIGYGIAIYQSQRFRSLTLGGFSPHRGVPGGMTPEIALQQPSIQRNPILRESIERRPEAMMFSYNELVRFGGATQALKTAKVPLLLFAGTEDPNEAANEMPEIAAAARDATFFAVEGADHTAAVDAVDIVAPRVIEFVQRVESRLGAAT